MNKRAIKLIILVSEIVYMILELCISYLFSPYFGSSNSVWTGIIGVILLSGSVGNYVGGKLAEKKEKNYIPLLFVLTSVFIFAVGVLSDAICVVLSDVIENNSLASLVSSLILLFPSSFCLGTLPPQLMSKSVDDDESSIGKIYMLSTIGGLLGTFVGGYFLIPYLGVNSIVFLCGIVTLLFGISCIKKHWKLVLLSIMIGGFYLSMIVSNDNASFGYENTLVFDSEYNRIMVMDTEDKAGEPVRKMMMDAGFESGTYLSEEKRYDLLFDYLKAFDGVVDVTGTAKEDLLLLGGAAYQFPKHILAHYDNVNIDVVELDGKCLEIAKEYFFLQDAVDTFDKDGKRLGLFIEDAKVYIRKCDKKYDIVYNDLFAGELPVRDICTKEGIEEIYALLKDDGYYVINLMDKTDVDTANFLKAESKTLSLVFPYLYVERCSEVDENNVKMNYRVVASKVPLPLNNIDFNYDDGAILTSNYCPVESLVK